MTSSRPPAPGTAIFSASAPVRLDFAGGWTDVAPFALEERGIVVNAAIDLRAEAEVRTGGEGFLLNSDDLKDSLHLPGREALAADGRLDLHKAALRRSGLGAAELRTRCDAPAGSGLGSSGALDVALVAALDAARGLHRPPLELAEEAFALESVEAGLPGGRQDQYAAVLGGFHRFEFDHGRVSAHSLAIHPDFAGELADRIVVCYTGVSRVSSRAIERVVDAYRRGDSQVVGALLGLADVALRMSDAFVAQDLERIGKLLNENWALQQRLDPDMRTAEMAALESTMAEAGVLGCKAAGAGAGGSMFFLVKEPGIAASAAHEAGARVLPVAWSAEGVRVW